MGVFFLRHQDMHFAKNITWGNRIEKRDKVLTTHTLSGQINVVDVYFSLTIQCACN